jgi:antitoxin component YwqK of YwqJK toxin-antitoxin module
MIDQTKLLKIQNSILIFLWIGLSACNSFFNSQDQNSSQKSSIRYNEVGDTVLMNYNEKGVLQSEVTVKNGQMNGISFNYYDNGKIENEITYKDGKKDGRSTWNYENGELYRETQYVDGVMEGVQKKYYKGGRLMAEIPYSKGELQPGTKEYTTEGTLKKNIPDIVFEEIDKIAFDNKYILRISLSKNKSGTKFWRYIETMKGNMALVNLKLQDNHAEISWDVPKGAFVMEKVRVIAEFNTTLNNPVKIEKTYNVAVENR